MIRKECISILAACLLGISSLTAFAAAPVIPQMPDRIIRAENAKEGLNAPSSEKDLVLLTWAENPESVRYEVEIFRGIPYNLDRNEPLADHVYDNQRIYTNKVIIDLSKIPAGDGVLYWRVRPIDADWTGLAPFSAPMEVRSTMKRLGRDAPLPNVYRPENGSSLLYPVYSYAGIPGAAKYEVEVTDSYPETLSGTAPSAHRVFSRVTSLSNVYDSDPRIGTYYWRVRGMDETGAPVGEWSLPERVRNDVESRYNVGIFGDSITQGGGHLYHSPADMAYSYVSYLDFPAVNMGRSGDTVEMMYDRFDRDVLPFHVKYLLIMGGINDLRMGTSPDKAIEYLREKGLAASAKKAGRIAAEGMSYALVENGVGALVEVNCETDFCAKSDLFVAFVKDIAKVIAEQNPADVDALMNCKYLNSDLSVSETMPEKVMSIGENLQIRRFVRFAENTSVGYVHAGGKIGVLVNLAVEGDIDATEIGKNIAMQIAALNPRFWDKAQVTDEVLAEEKKIALALMDTDPKMASKPEAVKEKIVMGKMNKFYEENCLMQMEFVRSDIFQGSVEKYVADAAKKLGGSVKFVDAVRFQTGEGIEKKQEDFAAEVAAQMNMGK